MATKNHGTNESKREQTEIIAQLQSGVQSLAGQFAENQRSLEYERNAHKESEMDWKLMKETLLKNWTSLNEENKKMRKVLKKMSAKLAAQKAKREQEREIAMKKISDLEILNQKLRDQLSGREVQEAKKTTQTMKDKTPDDMQPQKSKEDECVDHTEKKMSWKRLYGMVQRKQ